MRLIDIEPCEKLGHAMILYATDGGMLIQIRSCDLPTIDAVPVVRCAECIHYIPNAMGEKSCSNDAWNCEFLVPTEPDDFCSYGERKDGE